MSEVAREILIGSLGSLLGALFGSLGTIATFGSRISNVEARETARDAKIGEVDTVAKKACVDANRAWVAFRELRVVVKERTEEHPRYDSRDSGEGPVQS